MRDEVVPHFSRKLWRHWRVADLVVLGKLDLVAEVTIGLGYDDSVVLKIKIGFCKCNDFPQAHSRVESDLVKEMHPTVIAMMFGIGVAQELLGFFFCPNGLGLQYFWQAMLTLHRVLVDVTFLLFEGEERSQRC